MPVEREDLDALEARLTAEANRKDDGVWSEIKDQVWKAIDELRSFRTWALVGVLGIVATGGVAFGALQWQVMDALKHESVDGLHQTVAQATATAERVQKIESEQKALTEKVDSAAIERSKTAEDVEEIKGTTTDVRIEQTKIQGKLDRILDAIERSP